MLAAPPQLECWGTLDDVAKEGNVLERVAARCWS